MSRYKEQEDAEEAQAAMDGCEFNGKNISVTFAQSDRKCKHTSLLRLVLDSFRLSLNY